MSYSPAKTFWQTNGLGPLPSPFPHVSLLDARLRVKQLLQSPESQGGFKIPAISGRLYSFVH